MITKRFLIENNNGTLFPELDVCIKNGPKLLSGKMLINPT